jgi:hypothetical protein
MKQKNKDDFCLYLFTSPYHRSTSFIGVAFLGYGGLYSESALFFCGWTNLQQGKDSVAPVIAFAFLFFAMTWLPAGILLFLCYHDRLSFKGDHFEVRTLKPRQKADFKLGAISAFGQRANGEIELFGIEGSLLASLPIPLNTKKDQFLLMIRHHLVHFDIAEIGPEETEELYQRSRRL